MNFSTRQATGTMMQRVGGGGLEAIFCIFAVIFLIALTVLVVVVTINLIKHGKMKGGLPLPQRKATEQIAPAIAILNERLAKGEITSEDYQRIKDEISK